MQEALVSLAGNVPAAVAVIVAVGYFLRYLRSRDKDMNMHVDRVATSLDNCAKQFGANANALQQNAVIMDKSCKIIHDLTHEVKQIKKNGRTGE